MGKKRNRKKRRKKAKIKRTQTFEIKESKPDKINSEAINEIEKPEFLEDIFQKFIEKEEEPKVEEKENEEDSGSDSEFSDSDEEEEEKNQPPKLSRKKSKKMNRMTISELKLKVNNPEFVEKHDNNSQDPLFLIELKSGENYVRVPNHWKKPKRYLQSKKGMSKSSYRLPEYIQKTGIEEIRNAIIEKNKKKSAKQRMRERMDPKLGKNDLDYNVLHDAFFKHQTKPVMSRFGETYYDGKDFQMKVRHFKPGKLSKQLRSALGMPENAPPPWLINMQRFGPPPSFPWLKLPGVNAPLPIGARWGYHPGGWGQAPRDSNGKLLFQNGLEMGDEYDSVDYSRLKRFGELISEFEEEESDEEESEEEEEEEEEEVKEEEEEEPLEEEVEKKIDEITEMEVKPFDITKSVKTENEEDEEKKSLYQVLEKKENNITNDKLMTSTFSYSLSKEKKETKKNIENVKPEKKELKRKRNWDLEKKEKKRRKFKF